MTWTEEEIELRIAVDVEDLAATNSHWFDVDRAAIAEALGRAANRGPEFYEKELKQLERMLAQAEAQNTEAVTH